MKLAGRAPESGDTLIEEIRFLERQKKSKAQENWPAPSGTHLDPSYCTCADEMHALTAIVPAWPPVFAAPFCALVVAPVAPVVVLQVLGTTGCGPLCTGLG